MDEACQAWLAIEPLAETLPAQSICDHDDAGFPDKLERSGSSASKADLSPATKSALRRSLPDGRRHDHAGKKLLPDGRDQHGQEGDPAHGRPGRARRRSRRDR